MRIYRFVPAAALIAGGILFGAAHTQPTFAHGNNYCSVTANHSAPAQSATVCGASLGALASGSYHDTATSSGYGNGTVVLSAATSTTDGNGGLYGNTATSITAESNGAGAASTYSTAVNHPAGAPGPTITIAGAANNGTVNTVLNTATDTPNANKCATTGDAAEIVNIGGLLYLCQGGAVVH